MPLPDLTYTSDSSKVIPELGQDLSEFVVYRDDQRSVYEFLNVILQAGTGVSLTPDMASETVTIESSGGGTSGFDLFADVVTATTGLDDADRLATADVSLPGEPNRYATVANLRTAIVNQAAVFNQVETIFGSTSGVNIVANNQNNTVTFSARGLNATQAADDSGTALGNVSGSLLNSAVSRARVFDRLENILVAGSNVVITANSQDDTVTIASQAGSGGGIELSDSQVADDSGTTFGSVSGQRLAAAISQARVFGRLETILHGGSNVIVTANNMDNTISISSTATGGGATNISITERAADVQVRSSTGSNGIIDPATDTAAGVMLPADRILLGDLPPTWTDTTYGLGVQRSWNGAIYETVVAIGTATGANPAADTTNWRRVGHQDIVFDSVHVSEPDVEFTHVHVATGQTVGSLVAPATRISGTGRTFSPNQSLTLIFRLTASQREALRKGWHLGVVGTIRLDSGTQSGTKTATVRVIDTTGSSAVLTSSPASLSFTETNGDDAAFTVLIDSTSTAAAAGNVGVQFFNTGSTAIAITPNLTVANLTVAVIPAASAASGTNIAITEGATSVEVGSSTGNNDSINGATASLAGVMLPADRRQLTALPPTWNGTVDDYSQNDQVGYSGFVYEAVNSVTGAAANDPPDTDTTNWRRVSGAVGSAGGATDLTLGARSTTSVVVESSTGSNVTLPSATTTQAGLSSAADQTHLEDLPQTWAPSTAYTAGAQRAWNGTVYVAIEDVSDTSVDEPQTSSSWIAAGPVVTVANDGTDLAGVTENLNFAGAGVTAAGTGTTKTITIPGAVAATETVQGVVELATSAETAALTDTTRAVVPGHLPAATTSQLGLIEVATATEATTGTDSARAITAAGVTAVVGNQVSDAERTAGTATTVRRFSPADIRAMVLAHEQEGLTQNETDARVTALVESWALQANSSEDVPDSKIPAGITRDTELATAIANFRTAAQITTEINTAITTALGNLNAISDGGDWAAGSAYEDDVVVKHDGATYLSLQMVGANTAATSEPGVGTDWETFWDRLGYEFGPPNAFVGGTIAGEVLTLTREGGTNPLELTLPGSETGTGAFTLTEIGSENVNIINSDTWYDTGIDIPDTVADGEVWAITAQGNQLNSEQIVSFFASEIVDATNSTDGGTIDTNSGTTSKDLGFFFTAYINTSDHQFALGRTAAGDILMAGSSSGLDPAPLNIYRVSVTGGVGEAPTRVETIHFDAIGDTTTAVEATPRSTNPIVVQTPAGSAPTSLTNVSGNDFDVAAGTYLVKFEGTATTGGNHAVGSFDIRDASDDSVLTRSTNEYLGAGSQTIGIEAFSILVLNEATQVNVRYLPTRQETSLAADWTASFTRWGGGQDTRTGFSPTDLGTTTFDIADTNAFTVALMNNGSPIVCPADGYIIAVFTVPPLGLVGSIEWVLAEDLRAAAVDSALTASLYTNNDNEIVFSGSGQSGPANGNEIIIQHIGSTTDQSDSGATILPSIASFVVTGEFSPPPGSIQGDVYNYALSISQSGHAASARIVGFAGTTSSLSPPSRAILRAVTNLSNETGSVTIPAGVSLTNAGDQYTIRLEVYATGDAPASGDTPSAYHDYVVTARAPSGEVHFGTIQYDANDADTAATAARIVFGDDDISTAGNVDRTWTFSGIPSTGEYIPYWAVPASLAQPVGWAIGSTDITAFVESAVSRTIGSVNYMIYLYNSDSRADDSLNGGTVTTRSS